MRRLIVLVALLVVAAGAAACGDDVDAPAARGSAPPGASGNEERATSATPTTRAPDMQRPRVAPEPGEDRQEGGLRGRVTRVIDGDTIRVESRGFETPVRLVGIDAPETRHPSRPVECFGPEASARARALVPVGAEVRLVTDPTQDTRDRYGRLLAYVYRQGESGARGSVNYQLVASGHARVYVFRVPFRHADAFRHAEREARAAGRGLWGPPCAGDTERARSEAMRPAPPAPGPSARAGCDPNYAGACVPPYPPAVSCRDIPEKRFRVVGRDVHGLDGDGDGIACES